VEKPRSTTIEDFENMKIWDRSHLLTDEQRGNLKLYWTNDVPTDKGKNGVACLLPKDAPLAEVESVIIKHVMTYAPDFRMEKGE